MTFTSQKKDSDNRNNVTEWYRQTYIQQGSCTQARTELIIIEAHLDKAEKLVKTYLRVGVFKILSVFP